MTGMAGSVPALLDTKRQEGSARTIGPPSRPVAHAYSPHRNRYENATVMASQLAEARDPATALNYLAATLDKADRRQLTRLVRRR